MYIQLSSLTKVFGKQTVLSNIFLSFEKGKIHGLVGRNGSGKTMIFRCICGYVAPTKGHVVVDGLTIGKDIAFPKNMGLILETPGFLPHLSGKKNLEMLYTISHKTNHEAIAVAMEKVGLDYRNQKPVSKYSLGMRQRLGIAQAIMENPALLVLDEPFNGLDNQGTAHIRQLLLALKNQGTTILLASHNPLDIETLCDTVHYLDGGKIISSQAYQLMEKEKGLLFR